MDHFGGLDVSVKETSVCIVDDTGRIVREVKVPTVCGSLRQACEELDKDRAFLKKGNVFTDDAIDAYLELKMEEVEKFEMFPHPIEFDMYYSV